MKSEVELRVYAAWARSQSEAEGRMYRSEGHSRTHITPTRVHDFFVG